MQSTCIVSLQLSRQQVVFTMLVPSYQQAVPNLSTTCATLMRIILWQCCCYDNVVAINPDIMVLCKKIVSNLAMQVIIILVYHGCSVSVSSEQPRNNCGIVPSQIANNFF